MDRSRWDEGRDGLTVLGRYFFAVGGNPEAARLSGIPVDLVRTAAFVISGMSAGIAGVLAASRTSSAQPDLGIGLELSAIAASVVGGTSIVGGIEAEAAADAEEAFNPGNPSACNRPWPSGNEPPACDRG